VSSQCHIPTALPQEDGVMGLRGLVDVKKRKGCVPVWNGTGIPRLSTL
jgi:hypothetical protein